MDMKMDIKMESCSQTQQMLVSLPSSPRSKEIWLAILKCIRPKLPKTMQWHSIPPELRTSVPSSFSCD